MNLRDLQYLIALSDEKHFGKAADKCFVSQPALSMQIKKLENDLGIQLIERTNKSVLLTDVGELMVTHARQILQQVNEMRDIAKFNKDPLAGELTIGIIPTIAPYLLPHIFPKIIKHFPKLKIFLVEEQTAVLLQKLKEGKIDAAILALPITDMNFTETSIFTEEFLLAVPTTHPLAHKKLIHANDLKYTDLLLLEEGHCLREQALEFCAAHKAQEHHSFRATSLETLRHMVASGTGITLIPELACKPSAGIHYVPFANPKPSRQIGLIWRHTTAKKILLTELAGFIKKLMK